MTALRTMRTKGEILSLLTNPGVIAVVRAQKPEQVLPLTESLLAGAVKPPGRQIAR